MPGDNNVVYKAILQSKLQSIKLRLMTHIITHEEASKQALVELQLIMDTLLVVEQTIVSVLENNFRHLLLLFPKKLSILPGPPYEVCLNAFRYYMSTVLRRLA